VTLEELRQALEETTTPEGADWVRETEAAVADDPTAVRARFPAVGRKVGRGTLDPDADHDDVHAWTVDDAARVLILAAMGEAAEAELAELYRFGDTAERRGLLRALPYLPLGDRGRGLVDDAVRTNDTRLVAAALGPYATEHLDDAAYDQAVLKCVFMGIPLARIPDLETRADAELARMLAAYAHERVAAGRDVPNDVWPWIDRFPPEAELAALADELHANAHARRRAAAAALAQHDAIRRRN